MLRLGAVAAFSAVAAGLAHAEGRTIVACCTKWPAQLDEPATGLIQQAALSRHGGDGLVTVTGSADATGTPEAAKLLSAARAQAVVDAPVRDRVPSNRTQEAANGAAGFVHSPTESRRVAIGIPLPVVPCFKAPALRSGTRPVTDRTRHMAQHARPHDVRPSRRRLG